MIGKDQISEICKTALSESQFLVEIKVNKANDIFVYIDDYNGLTIEECKRISRLIESQFDRDEEDFSLEVSSPGLSKSFKVDEQYKKALNTEIEVLLTDGEKIRGILTNINDENNSIEILKIKKVKIDNKKQNIEEKHIILKRDIKTTKSVIIFSKKNKE